MLFVFKKDFLDLRRKWFIETLSSAVRDCRAVNSPCLPLCFISLLSFLELSCLWLVKATVRCITNINTRFLYFNFTWIHYFWEHVVCRLFGKCSVFFWVRLFPCSITEVYWDYNFEKVLATFNFQKSKFDFLHWSLHPCKDVEVFPSITKNQAEQACQIRDLWHRNVMGSVGISLFSVWSEGWTCSVSCMWQCEWAAEALPASSLTSVSSKCITTPALVTDVLLVHKSVNLWF